jgi:hypothetical protein
MLIALLVSPSFFALAKGKGFKDVVKHIETNYGAKKVRIPFLGLANFAIKLIRPAGVKGFKLAVFEDQNFSAHERAASFDSVMREAYDKDWRPMVQVSSKRNGASHTFIYVRNSGKDVQFALAVLEDREAVVLEVKFNPDAAARFLENPKIMGVSLGKSIRGNNAAVASNARLRPAASNPSGPSGNPLSADSSQAAPPQAADVKTDEAKPAPALDAASNGGNNPPLQTDAKAEDSSAAPAITEVKPNLPGPGAIRIETRLVNLNVKAMDKGGRPLTDLKVEDFVVTEDGVKQDVSHFKPVNAPCAGQDRASRLHTQVPGAVGFHCGQRKSQESRRADQGLRRRHGFLRFDVAGARSTGSNSRRAQGHRRVDGRRRRIADRR